VARILVVDDEPDSLLAARAALVGAGHACVLAADGERALEVLAAGGIDLLVIDPAMPLHDAWPVLDAATIPVVALSAAVRGPADGVVATVPKPVGAEALVTAVRSALAPRARD